MIFYARAKHLFNIFILNSTEHEGGKLDMFYIYLYILARKI